MSNLSNPIKSVDDKGNHKEVKVLIYFLVENYLS